MTDPMWWIEAMRTMFMRCAPALMCAVLLPVVVAAPAAAEPPGPRDFALTVSPSRLVVPADRHAAPRPLTVTNHGSTPIEVVARLASFTAGADGGLVFSPEAEHSAAGWVTLQPERFSLAAGDAAQVHLHITAPASAEPGEYQVAAVFSVPPAGATGIGVARGVGAPVYITVPGAAADSVELTGLRTPRVTLGGPIVLTATVRNAGTVHRDFVADNRLRATVAGQTVPFPDFTLLRGGHREISTRWTDPPLWCVCRATATVVNPGGAPRPVTATVVVVSVPALGAGAALALAIAALLWVLRHRLRRRPPAGPDAPVARPGRVGVGVGGHA